MVITEENELIDMDISTLNHEELMDLVHNGELKGGRSDILGCHFYFSRFYENFKLETHNGRLYNILASNLARKERGYDSVSGNVIYFNLVEGGEEVGLNDDQKQKLITLHKEHRKTYQIGRYEIGALYKEKDKKSFEIDKYDLLKLIKNNKICTRDSETRKMKTYTIEYLNLTLDNLDKGFRYESMPCALTLPIVYKKTSRKIYNMRLFINKI